MWAKQKIVPREHICLLSLQQPLKRGKKEYIKFDENKWAVASIEAGTVSPKVTR